jgi:hypothetical protein
MRVCIARDSQIRLSPPRGTIVRGLYDLVVSGVPQRAKAFGLLAPWPPPSGASVYTVVVATFRRELAVDRERVYELSGGESGTLVSIGPTNEDRRFE